MKPFDIKDNTYTDFNKQVNDRDPKFKVGDNIRISKYKNIFTKGYWSEEVFVISKIKDTALWIYAINHLDGKDITGTYYEK